MSSPTTPDSGCRISQDFDVLRQTEVFSSAPAELIKLFAYLAKHRTYQPGETIISQGKKAENCYFVINGTVDISALHNGEDIMVQRLEQHSFFGELALLAHFKWFFNAKAVTKTELLIITRESFKKIVERFPDRRDMVTEKIVQLRIKRFEHQTTAMLEQLEASNNRNFAEEQPVIV